jgi:choline dehydrogenase-like flavoprotein
MTTPSASTEILVVGAGAGGAAVAWRLATQGFRVTCLEQGDWTPPETGPGADPRWERRRVAAECHDGRRSPSTSTSTRRSTLVCQPGMVWV